MQHEERDVTESDCAENSKNPLADIGLSTSCSNFLKKLLKSYSKTLKVAQKLPQNPKVAFNFLA